MSLTTPKFDHALWAIVSTAAGTVNSIFINFNQNGQWLLNINCIVLVKTSYISSTDQ